MTDVLIFLGLEFIILGLEFLFMDTNTAIALASIVSAISTGVLVVITAYYAMQTRRQAEFLREQISTSIRPFLQVESFKCKTNTKSAGEVSPVLIPEWAISLINVGNGAALAVSITVSADISVKEADNNAQSPPHRVDFTSSAIGHDIYLRPGQAETYALTPIEKAAAGEAIKPGYVMVRATCKDVSGKALNYKSEVWLGYDNLTWDVSENACILPFEEAYPKKLLA
jgi:hypothetical protein